MTGKRKIKLLALSLTLFLCSSMLTGCWDRIEIEDRLFITSMGFDTPKPEEKQKPEDHFKISFTAPLVGAIKEGEGPAFRTFSNVNRNLMDTVEGLLEKYGKQYYFGHTRVVMLGEEFLRDPHLMKEFIDGMARSHEFHKSMYVFATPGRVEDVFEIEPRFDKLLAPYIAGIAENSEYITKVDKQNIGEFIMSLINKDGGTVMPLLKADKKENEIRVSGSAVIKDFKLIGFLEENETAAYRWLTGEAKGGFVAVNYENVPVSLRHSNFRRTIHLNKVENGKIYLTYDMGIEGVIEEFTYGKKLLDTKTMSELEAIVEKKIKQDAEALVRKFQKELRVDLIDARDYLEKRHPKVFEQIEKNYETYFSENIVINVTPEVQIRRIGTMR